LSTVFEYHFPFPRYPAVRIFLALIAGITLTYWSEIPAWHSGILVLFLLAFYSLFTVKHRNTLRQTYYKGMIVTYLLLIVVFGSHWASINIKNNTPEIATKLNELYAWEKVKITGTVLQHSLTDNGNYMADILADTVWVESIPVDGTGFKVRLYADSTDIKTQFRISDKLKVVVQIYPLEEIRNPHDFDYKNFLAERDIHVHAGLEQVLYKLQHRQYFMAFLRSKVNNLIKNNFSPSSEPLATALLLGNKKKITPQTKQQFSRSGLSHIMAVSGLHVGFVVAPFWLLIPYIRQWRLGKWLGLILLALLLFVYAGVTGFPASVIRASVMALLLAYSFLWYKAADALNLMAVAGIILLLVDPAQLFDVGFQLSFTAVAVILLIFPIIKSRLPGWIFYKWYGQPIAVMVVSAIVQIGLAPVLMYYFGEFSLIGPLVNAVIIPFLGIIMVWAIGSLMVALFSMPAGELINIPAEWFIQFLQWTTAEVSSWVWTWINMEVTTGFIFIIWFFMIAWVASWPIPKFRWKWAIALLCSLVLYQSIQLTKKWIERPLRVIYFDVGQGDAALLSTPDEHHILIDTGVWRSGYSSGEATILPHLKAENIQKLDAVYLSHPHADHIGGIEAVMENVPVATIYNSGSSYTSDLYYRYIKKADSLNIPLQSVQAGDIHQYGHLMIQIYGPLDAKNISDVNESSIILEAIYGKTEFLFMGDAVREQEVDLLHNFGTLSDTDVLKVAHHGSKTSSDPRFLKTATPDMSVVSLGWQNRYDHPHTSAVNRLYSTSEAVLFTSLQGAIILESDGRMIKQITWKKQNK